MEIIDLIGELDDLFFLEQPSEEKIQDAEYALGLKFSDEFRE